MGNTGPAWPDNPDLNNVAAEIYRSFSHDLEEGYRLSASARIAGMKALHRLCQLSLTEGSFEDTSKIGQMVEHMESRWLTRFPRPPQE